MYGSYNGGFGFLLLQLKFRTIIITLFILLSTIALSAQTERHVYIFAAGETLSRQEFQSLITYLRDYTQTILFEGYPDDQIIHNTKSVDTTVIKELLNIVFSEGGDAFFYISAVEEVDELTITIRLYSHIGEIIDEETFIIEDLTGTISIEFEERWQVAVRNMMDILPEPKNRTQLDRKTVRRNIKFKHDFPLVNISLQAISGKFFIDRRSDEKIFSFFPLNIRLGFFPLKYMEVGLFFDIDYSNMIYKYNESQLWSAGLILKYGFFMGLSWFTDDAHYSIGLQAYNFYYYLDHLNWTKPATVNAYFLPQFSIYQKWDFKLFKIIYFSMFINIKTIPKFYLTNNQFYSKPFDYDFVVLEFSFIGFSIIF